MIQEKIRELDNIILNSNICDFHKDLFSKRHFINIIIIEKLINFIDEVAKKDIKQKDIIFQAFNQIIVEICSSYLARQRLREELINLCRYGLGFSYFYYHNPLFTDKFGFEVFCIEDITKIIKAEFARMIFKGVNNDSDKAFFGYLVKYFSGGLKGDLFFIVINILKELRININEIKTYWNEKVSVEKLYDFFENMASEKGNDEKIITIKDLNDLDDNPNTYLEGWSECVYHKIALSPIEYMSEKELAPCFEFLIKRYFFDCFKTKFKDENIKHLKNILIKDDLRDYLDCESIMEAFSYFLDNKFPNYLYSSFNEKISSDKIKEPNYQNTNYDELFGFCCKVLDAVDLSCYYINNDSLNYIISNFLEHKADKNKILEVLVNNTQKIFFDEFEERLNYLEVFFDEFAE